MKTYLISFAKILISNRLFGSTIESLLARLSILKNVMNPLSEWKISSQIEDLGRRIQKEEIPTSVNTKKSVVVISRFFMQNQISGVNFTLAILSFALVRRGFKVIVVTESNRLWRKKAEVNGLTIIGIPNFLFQAESELPAYYGTWSRSVAKTISMMENQQDIVSISTLAGLEGYSTYKVHPEVKQIVYLVTDHLIHNGQINPGPAKTPRLEKLKLAEVSYLDNPSVLTVGDSDVIVQDLAHVLELESLLAKSKTIRIGIPWNNGDDKSLFDDPYILYVGSVSSRKGVSTLLSAWSAIYSKASMNRFKLIICGPIGDDFLSETRIADNSPQQRISRIIDATEHMKGTLLRHASLVVIPSNYESFGMVAVEAMQFGKKIIASRIGGLPEVLDSCATYFEPGNYEDLGKLIVSSISTPDIHDPDRVMARAKEFGVGQMCIQFESIFD